MRRSLSSLFGVFLLSASASADIVPNGFKSVRLSIQVDAEVPAGRALVLANTFRGADVLPTGKIEKVDWHPMAGEMRVVSVSAADAEEIKKSSGPGANREKLQTILARGKDCSTPFAGVRTLPDSNPADEVRWRFRISFKGEACQTDEFATQYLSKDGKLVGSGSDNTRKPTQPTTPAPTATDTALPAPNAPSAPNAPPAPPTTQPSKSGCGSCRIGEPARPSSAGWFLAALLGLAAARRRRAKR